MSVRKFVLGLLDAAVKIAFVIVVILLISRYSSLAYNYGYHIFNQVPVSSGTGRTVTVRVEFYSAVIFFAANHSRTADWRKAEN